MARPSCTTDGRAPSVLVVSSTFPRWTGDATARFAFDLAALAAPVWDVTALAPHHPGASARERVGDVDVVRFRYFVPSSRQRLCYGAGILPNARASALARLQIPCLVVAEAAAVARLVRARRFDLVHAHFLLPQGAVCALARGTIPLVVSVHGSDLFALRRFDAVRGAVLDRAAIVTVNSEATRRELLRRFPAAERKVRLLPMGVDPALFHGERAASEEVIAFVGRLTKQKGVTVLLQAFAELVASGRRLRLVVAGEGPALTRASGVELRGPLSPSAVAALYREAGLLVVPSLSCPDGTEALGLVAVEAMAAGCPVVASRTGGLAELVGDDERGLLATPGDATSLAECIHRALADPAATRARAEAARAYVLSRYAWPKIRASLLSLYDEARSWA